MVYHHKGRGFSAIEIIIAILVIGIIGALGWIFWNNANEADGNNNTGNTQTDDKTASVELTPAEATAKLKSRLAETYTVVDEKSDQELKEGEVRIVSQSSTPFYKVDGFDYYTNYEGGSNLSVLTYADPTAMGTTPTPEAKRIRQLIGAAYKDLGLTLVQEDNNSDDVYTGKGLICGVTGVENSNMEQTEAGCGEMKKYEAEAIKLQPFAQALPASQINDSTTLSHLTIEPSLVTGYQKAELNVGEIDGGGYTSLFYRKSDDKWQYFTDTQVMLDCSAYNTVDIRNAFKGTECIDSAGNLSAV